MPWVAIEIPADNLEQDLINAESVFLGGSLQYPIVGKQGIGFRVTGVKLPANRDDFARFIAAFPTEARVQLQQANEWEAEAGVSYVRHPDAASGNINLLRLKYAPYVVGEGVRTLVQFDADDAGADTLQHWKWDAHLFILAISGVRFP